MSVDVNFFNNNGEANETQFDIHSFDIVELTQLFGGFCKENGYRNNSVTSITIVQIADSIDALK